MAIVSREQLKSWFRKGLYPLESQFASWIDSFWHKNDKLPISQVDNLTQILNEKADATILGIKQNKEDDDLNTDNKTIVGAINEITNRLDGALPRSGRLIEVDSEGYVNSRLLQGDGIFINEETGEIGVQDKDMLFEQADKVVANNISLTNFTRDNTNANLTILEQAEAMPVEIPFNSCSIGNGGTWNYDTIYNNGYLWTNIIDENGVFTLTLSLTQYISSTLADFIDRVIVVSSPRCLHDSAWMPPSGVEGVFQSFPQHYSRKSINVPEEAALMVRRDYEQSVRLHDKLKIYVNQTTPTASYIWGIYYVSGEQSIYRPSNTSVEYNYSYLMGKTYAQLRSAFKNTDGNPEADNDFSLVGMIKGYTTGMITDYSYYDAFFGVFPYCTLVSVQINSLNQVVFTMRLDDGVSRSSIPHVNGIKARIIFPKNEIISKIKSLIADGTIDEYGNYL